MIYRFQTLDSTNNKLKQMAQNKRAQDGDVVFANTQTAGKGRAGRIWLDAHGKALLFSILLDAEIHKIVPENLSLVPIIAAVVVADAIEKKFSISLETKWPNDLLFRNKKLCGILCESLIEGNSIRAVIIGIGINFDQTKNDFPEKIRERATSIKLITDVEYEKEEILMTVVEQLQKLLVSDDGKIYLNLWKKRCPFLGKQISFHAGDVVTSGEFVDLNPKGALILETENGLQTFFSGEIV